MHHVKPCIPIFLHGMFVHDDFPGHVTSKVVSFLKLETPFTAVSVYSISWGKTFSRLNCVSTACARTAENGFLSLESKSAFPKNHREGIK